MFFFSTAAFWYESKCIQGLHLRHNFQVSKITTPFNKWIYSVTKASLAESHETHAQATKEH